MPVISISQDLYSQGEEIAEKVSQRLGYQCIGPEMIKDLCESQGFSSSKIDSALWTTPKLFDHMIPAKEQYLAVFRAVFFEYMRRDNIVYYGLAGHIFLADVPNVIKVRITAGLAERTRWRMLREGLSPKQAQKRLIREDKGRSRWTKQHFDKDNQDPRLYDLYLNLKNISLETAALVVADTAGSLNGNAMMMDKMLADKALAARIESRLLEVFPGVEALADDGDVFIRIQGSILQEETIIKKAGKMLSSIQGIKSARVGVAPSVFVPF
jgi:cytidylate kinase